MVFQSKRNFSKRSSTENCVWQLIKSCCFQQWSQLLSVIKRESRGSGEEAVLEGRAEGSWQCSLRQGGCQAGSAAPLGETDCWMEVAGSSWCSHDGGRSIQLCQRPGIFLPTGLGTTVTGLRGGMDSPVIHCRREVQFEWKKTPLNRDTATQRTRLFGDWGAGPPQVETEDRTVPRFRLRDSGSISDGGTEWASNRVTGSVSNRETGSDKEAETDCRW